ncbi:MAG: aminotransferase class I/II-fold pyridoxal phosphate-dependent enzyme [Phycisphaera sp.]|nr:aminotransferase class I/II-fold pyridoxal phosphate-dependent enzyme [Phycisphaera sp.]
MFDPTRFTSDRARRIDASGIRRVFDLAATLKDPINLSIGQPDFDVPDTVKEAAIRAVRKGINRYTLTQGVRELHERITRQLDEELPEWGTAVRSGEQSILVTSGVSGGLVLAMLACVGPGDEVLIPDPYFVMYKHLVTLAGATPVYIDTYPDFQLTADRIESQITPRTKMLLFNSPSNPTGVVSPPAVCADVARLCSERNILLLTDEIYDEFCYEKTPRHGKPRCPTPATAGLDMLLMRGFSKTYGMTGWRLGYAVGPKPIVEQMTKLQQYSFVCAPSMVQVAGVGAMDLDMSPYVEAYRQKRDTVVSRLTGSFDLTTPGGAFYAFPKVPERLGVTATKFVERAVQEHGLLIIPGSVFSSRDTHFRISYACDNKMLNRGLDALLKLARI